MRKSFDSDTSMNLTKGWMDRKHVVQSCCINILVHLWLFNFTFLMQLKVGLAFVKTCRTKVMRKRNGCLENNYFSKSMTCSILVGNAFALAHN